MPLDITNNSATRAAGDLLNKKYGVLPFWGWLVVAGGTAFLVRKYMNRQSDAANAATGDASSATDLVNTGTDGVNSYQYPGAMYGGGGSSAPYPGQPTAPTDDLAAWQEKAVRALVDKGIGAYDAQLAIGLYLRSQPLTAQQRAIISEAIALVGTPPGGIPNPAPNPAPNPNPAPPGQRTVLTEILITPRRIPKVVGDSVIYDVRWLERGTRRNVTGNLQVQWATGNGPYLNMGTLRVTNGVLPNVSQKITGAAGRRSIRLTTTASDTVHASSTSNAITFTVNK